MTSNSCNRMHGAVTPSAIPQTHTNTHTHTHALSRQHGHQPARNARHQLHRPRQCAPRRALRAALRRSAGGAAPLGAPRRQHQGRDAAAWQQRARALVRHGCVRVRVRVRARVRSDCCWGWPGGRRPAALVCALRRWLGAQCTVRCALRTHAHDSAARTHIASCARAHACATLRPPTHPQRPTHTQTHTHTPTHPHTHTQGAANDDQLVGEQGQVLQGKQVCRQRVCAHVMQCAHQQHAHTDSIHVGQHACRLCEHAVGARTACTTRCALPGATAPTHHAHCCACALLRCHACASAAAATIHHTRPLWTPRPGQERPTMQGGEGGGPSSGADMGSEEVKGDVPAQGWALCVGCECVHGLLYSMCMCVHWLLAANVCMACTCPGCTRWLAWQAAHACGMGWSGLGPRACKGACMRKVCPSGVGSRTTTGGLQVVVCRAVLRCSACTATHHALQLPAVRPACCKRLTRTDHAMCARRGFGVAAHPSAGVLASTHTRCWRFTGPNALLCTRAHTRASSGARPRVTVLWRAKRHSSRGSLLAARPLTMGAPWSQRAVLARCSAVLCCIALRACVPQCVATAVWCGGMRAHPARCRSGSSGNRGCVMICACQSGDAQGS
jgi:hypothetical protein